MGRSHETFNKKNVRDKKEKKRKEKEKKKLNKKESRDGNNLDDMIAYVDEYGNITSTPPDPSQKKIINPEDIRIGTPKSQAPDYTETIRKGIVSFFNDSKGYGFIKDAVTQESFFVHVNGLVDPIKENNKVTFEIVPGPKGLNAVNVKLDK
ncbi:MAG: cold shock domain-containing protein [Bacteroidota bacterium]